MQQRRLAILHAILDGLHPPRLTRSRKIVLEHIADPVRHTPERSPATTAVTCRLSERLAHKPTAAIARIPQEPKDNHQHQPPRSLGRTTSDLSLFMAHKLRRACWGLSSLLVSCSSPLFRPPIFTTRALSLPPNTPRYTAPAPRVPDHAQPRGSPSWIPASSPRRHHRRSHLRSSV